MSAYGAIAGRATSEVLPSTLWRPLKAVDASNQPGYVTIHHLTLSTAKALPGLVEYLHKVFADELERGLTYPQEILPGETYTLAAFEAYYFAADVLIAVLEEDESTSTAIENGAIVQYDIAKAARGRSWEECVAGCYYVKPNYPGRSSHICNAGFLVPPAMRAKGVGKLLARSFMHYAPRLGYEASVFNLVYVNNTASVRLWESLGFTKAGLIPRAGRLKKADSNPGEEFVDAWVFYHRFEEAR
ncbi:acyl-CoA N-acyltransferase [Wolfiporia cocos MD-104 SS10]|uniref:Acyl-CoA N-acyltransferase n=1 Tax=Wolfiporia cocos (strain MD-104) TaxID=742152 RepID=A0A2H3J062_WOLCO|nr:acyl-CoA N-acyltransferase [Wolfiporia cocos MD-104 SS10]